MKNIIKGWMGQYPLLLQYTNSTLFMKVEIFMLGLRIEKVLSDTYRVVFECRPLWVKERKSRDTPMLWSELVDNKNGQYFISIQRHNELFQDAIKYSKSQFGFLLKEIIDVAELYNFIDTIISQKIKKHNPIDLYRLFEFQLALALYFEDTIRYNKIKQDIEKEITFWNADDFSDLFSMSGNPIYIKGWETEISLSQMLHSIYKTRRLLN